MYWLADIIGRYWLITDIWYHLISCLRCTDIKPYCQWKIFCLCYTFLSPVFLKHTRNDCKNCATSTERSPAEFLCYLISALTQNNSRVSVGSSLVHTTTIMTNVIQKMSISVLLLLSCFVHSKYLVYCHRWAKTPEHIHTEDVGIRVVINFI